MSSNLTKLAAEEQFHQMLTFIEMCCIGGTAGYPVFIVLRDFPPRVVSEICRIISGWFESTKVGQVSSLVDAQRLDSRLSKVNVVFVLPSRKGTQYFNDLCWKIEQKRGKNVSLPVVITSYHADIDDSPGTTVIFCGDPNLSATTGRWWLNDNQPKSVDVARVLESGTTPVVVELLKAIHAASEVNSLSLPDICLIKSLLIGYLLNQSPEQHQLLTRSVRDLLPAYREVRQCLQHPMLRSSAEPFDDRTLLMVRRANALLSPRSGGTALMQGNFGARSGTSSTTGAATKTEPETFRNTITFRELVNLGNQRSQEFKAIVEHSSRDASFLETLGISIKSNPAVARSPSIRQSGTTDDVVDAIAWSSKQVRTRFERLRQLKLVDVKRIAANGAFAYLLPQELHADRSRFSHLPQSEDVEKLLMLR